MTDPISMYGRHARLDAGVRSGQSDKASESSDAPPSGTGALVAATPTRDEFVLSETARNALHADTFDRNKVEAIKMALREGNYPLDSRRIAESFVAIERLIGG